ncbi:hypothetical protein HET73_07155 [Wolbachia endosymbiont of Atemnus politus]|uniref:hypothetical protein n=1 Tax=Wolbachia endosymbiont of Atemnus politus TaxID=2682840 RepID=UPI0015729C12|nr:hypothetical protein [Wolbachia endosymbiont of Atemnus politus]NSM57054.1 hypothetical protein [Wolbachia endosymbiont of Atemnus politus]
MEELEVRLYPDKQNRDIVRVEVSDQEKWKRLKSYNEEIGKNCRFGGLLVKEAVEQGFFTRSGKLICSEEMSSSKKVSEGVEAAVEGLKPGDIAGPPSSNVSSPKESIQLIQLQRG